MKADDMQVGGNHYKKLAVTPWQTMESCMSAEEFVGFLRGNVIKYTMRCNNKGGVEDLKKAQHYLSKLLEVLDAI
jgi:hypothetical protein